MPTGNTLMGGEAVHRLAGWSTTQLGVTSPLIEPIGRFTAVTYDGRILSIGSELHTSLFFQTGFTSPAQVGITVFADGVDISWDGVNLRVARGIIGPSTVDVLLGGTATVQFTVTLFEPTGEQVQGISDDGQDMLVCTGTKGPTPVSSTLFKYVGASSTIADSFPFSADPELSGVSWNGVNLTFLGFTTRLLYRNVGFTSTQESQPLDVSSFELFPLGLEHEDPAERFGVQPPPGVYIAGDSHLKGYKLKGFSSSKDTEVDWSADGINLHDLCQDENGDFYAVYRTARIIRRFTGFSSTPNGSVDTTLLSPVSSFPFGVSADRVDVFLTDDATGELYQLIGFSSTQRFTISISQADTSPKGISLTAMRISLAGGAQNDLHRLGFMSSTVLDTAPISVGTFVRSISWNGSNPIWSGILGQFIGIQDGWSSTTTQLIAMNPVDGTPNGIEHGDFEQRLNPPSVAPNILPDRRIVRGRRVRGRSRETRRLTPTLLAEAFVPPTAGFAVLAKRRVAIARRRRGRSRSYRMLPVAIPAVPVGPPVGGFAITQKVRIRKAKRLARPRSRARRFFVPPTDVVVRRGRVGGLYRTFNAAGYRIILSSTGPPDPPQVGAGITTGALPYETGVLADATWYVSVSYFNGVIDSGFLPLGPAGETYVVLNIVSALLAKAAPNDPIDCNLESEPGGVIRVVALYLQTGGNRADEWAISYTTDTSTPGLPPAVAPDVTIVMATGGLAVLSYDLPAQAEATTVKVRIQTRRNDGTSSAPIWSYSPGATVKTTIVDTIGPQAPVNADRWPGRIPEDF